MAKIKNKKIILNLSHYNLKIQKQLDLIQKEEEKAKKTQREQYRAVGDDVNGECFVFHEVSKNGR